MDISTKWVSTEYRNIQFHVDIVTFEIATKKSNIKSLSSLLENYTKLVQKGFINTFCVLENSASMFVCKGKRKRGKTCLFRYNNIKSRNW